MHLYHGGKKAPYLHMTMRSTCPRARRPLAIAYGGMTRRYRRPSDALSAGQDKTAIGGRLITFLSNRRSDHYLAACTNKEPTVQGVCPPGGGCRHARRNELPNNSVAAHSVCHVISGRALFLCTLYVLFNKVYCYFSPHAFKNVISEACTARRN